jgi:hypothetical protein
MAAAHWSTTSGCQAIERRLDGREVLLPQRHTRGVEDAPVALFAAREGRPRQMRGGDVDECADRPVRLAVLVAERRRVLQ